MPGVFLQTWSGKTKIYEASFDNGAVSEHPVNPATELLTTCDRIVIFDPSTNANAAMFDSTVVPATLEATNRFPVWGGLRFQTSCYLNSGSQHEDGTGAEPSNVDLVVAFVVLGGQIQLLDFEVKDWKALSPNRHILIKNLPTLSFSKPGPSFIPYVLGKLDLSMVAPFDPSKWSVVASPTPCGVQFAMDLPITSDSGTDDITEFLSPFGIDFAANDAAFSAPGKKDQTHSLHVVQRPNRFPAGADSNSDPATAAQRFTILEIDMPATLLNSTEERRGAWDSLADSYLGSLTDIRGGFPVSFLPTFEFNSGGIFTVSYSLVDLVPKPKGMGAITGKMCRFRDPESVMAPGRLNIVPRAVQPKAATAVSCTATFPNVIRTDGGGLQVACQLSALDPANGVTEQACEERLGFYFAVAEASVAATLPASQPSVRMGAFQLQIPSTGKVTDGAETSIDLSLRLAKSKPADVTDDTDDAWSGARLDWLSLALSVAAVGAASQDEIPGEEYVPANSKYARTSQAKNAAVVSQRAVALVCPVQDLPEIKDAFVLIAQEACFEGHSQTLDLFLRQQSLSSSAVKLNLVVIDPEPFLVAQVTVDDYQSTLRDALTNQIASWNNRATSGAWQLVGGDRGFQLILPPQGLTEAMHKRKGLSDVTPGQPADYRFTPPANFSLQSAPNTQRFGEPPWNLRRILGYPGQSAPGAPVVAATFELLYGMSGTIQKRPGLFLAEIGSRLGQLAPALSDAPPWQSSADQQTRYNDAKKAWEDLAPRLRTRLAVLEPWDAAQPGGLKLTEKDNLTFTLRSAAELADPEHPDAAGATLRGSFAWAFESDDIYKALWVNPASVTADLSGLAFSSLGGWGQFTARYDLGKTSIIASVRMGRVESLTIERIGRVGNVWNRAKHVITYTRTVAATRQFYLEQEQFKGIPLVRKAAEYVEILERRRDVDPKHDTPGAYRACEFPDGDPPRIPVDSLWGGNVGAQGYMIPLWRPGAQPADVYPKPHVVLHLDTVQADSSTVRCKILDPEKLCFYTTLDSTQGTNTDLWPKDVDVDYAPVAQASVARTDPAVAQQIATKANGDVKQFQAPEEPWIEPGLGKFTYHLDVPAQAANVVSGFAAQPVGAALRNITFMRGLDASAVIQPVDAALTQLRLMVTAQANAVLAQYDTLVTRVVTAVAAGDAAAARIILDAKNALAAAMQAAHVAAASQTQILTAFDAATAAHLQAEARKLNDHVSNILRPALSQIAANTKTAADAWDHLRTQAVQRAGDAAATVATFSNGFSSGAISNAASQLCQALTKQLQTQLNFLETQIENEVAGLLTGANDYLLKVLATQYADLNAARVQVLAAWAGTQTPPPQPGFRDGILRQLRFTRGQVQQFLASVNATIDNNVAVTSVLAALNQLSTDLAAVADDLATAQSQATALVNNAAGAIDQKLAAADSLIVLITGGQQDSLRPLLATARADVQKSAAAAVADIQTAATVADLITAARAEVQSAIQTWNTTQAKIATVVKKLSDAVGAFGQTDIERILDRITQDLSAATDWSAFQTQAAKELAALKQNVQSTVAMHLDQLNKNIGGFATFVCQSLLNGALDTVLGALSGQFDATAIGNLFDSVKDLPTADAVRGKVENYLHGLESSTTQFVQSLLPNLPALPQLPADVSNGALFLLRGFGDVPKVPQLNFNAPFTAFRFAELDLLNHVPIKLPQVNLTPVLALANQLGDTLANPINLAVPTFQLADKLLPFNLENFDWKTLVPKIAGMDLTNLFQGLRAPISATNGVVVTHGLDPQSRSGWVEIDMTVPFSDEPAQILSFCGVVVTLLNATFTGSTRLEVQVSQPPKRSFRGAVHGNWDLRVGGYPIAILADSTLTFDDSGHFGFDIKPDKVKLQQALEFVADLLSTFLSGDGFTTSITAEGLKTTLDLPLPDIQAGAFGIANLRLGFGFALKISPFSLGVTLALAKPERPFTLTIFILGGAGYLTLDLLYIPGTGQLQATLGIGIFASASLAIALGPISGGVYAYFGITVSYTAKTGSAPDLQVAIVLMFLGQVSLLGFISVSLFLSLSAQYRSGGQLVGRGCVSYSIKIGPFFSIDVSADVSYTYSNASATLPPPPGVYDAAAQEYVGMFYN